MVLQPLEMLLAEQGGKRTDGIRYALLSWRINNLQYFISTYLDMRRELRKVVRFQP